ncbi:MAG: mucoidy inhibitor MuiA family protein [Candidatus Zixiibacteriota bacterium]
MRKIVIALLGFLLSISFESALVLAEDKPVDAPIKKVTVYPDRAMVTRIADLTLPAGDQSIVIENLPITAVDESFRVSATNLDGVLLLGMSHRTAYHSESPQQRVAELEKKIDQIQRFERAELVDRLDAYQQQKSLLLAIAKSSGEVMSDQVAKGTIAVSQWNEAYRFVGSRLIEVNDSIRSTQVKIDSIGIRTGLLQNELGLLRSNSGRSTKTVQIDLRLAKAGKVDAVLEYTVPGATWTPIYDARLATDTDLVAWTYNAEVCQHTGEDWTNVELTLSTTSPSQGAGPGEISPWSLSVVDHDLDRRITVTADKDVIDKFEVSNQAGISSEAMELRPVKTADELLRTVSGVETNSNGKVFLRGGRDLEVGYILGGVPMGDPLGGLGSGGVNLSLVSGSIIYSSDYVTSFKTQRLETIPSGDKKVRTNISEYQLQCRVEYLCRPHNSQSVYRLGTITNQKEAPLMPGLVAIFVGSDFLGNSYVGNLVVPGEEFKLPFGRDNNIKVERKVSAEKKTRTSDKIKKEAIIRIALTNLSGKERSIKVEEAVPLSRDSRIKITLGEIVPKPVLLDEAGKATWHISLKPKDSSNVAIPYRIEFASNLEVAGQ